MLRRLFATLALIMLAGTTGAQAQDDYPTAEEEIGEEPGPYGEEAQEPAEEELGVEPEPMPMGEEPAEPEVIGKGKKEEEGEGEGE